MNVGERASLIPRVRDGSERRVEGDPVLLSTESGLLFADDERAVRRQVAAVVCPYEDCGALLGFIPS